MKLPVATFLALMAAPSVAQEVALSAPASVEPLFRVTLDLVDVELRQIFQRPLPTSKDLNLVGTSVHCEFAVTDSNISQSQVFAYGGYFLYAFGPNHTPKYEISYGVDNFSDHFYAPGAARTSRVAVNQDVPPDTDLEDAYQFCAPDPQGSISVEYINWENAWSGFIVGDESQRRQPADHVEIVLRTLQPVSPRSVVCEDFCI